MSYVQYLPIDWLEHHPDNPRKDLGDLKELTASIKQSGIMQNLTVVQRDDQEQGYWVVIGNRRMEAARKAGLQELPCIISDMDKQTQLATMMMENMQRVDLTLLEQAQGVQMMMDLGMEIAEISKKTGLRKDTISRRAELTKYDAERVQKAIARGGTLNDFAKLSELEDPENVSYLLGKIGTPEFSTDFQWKKRQEQTSKNRGRLIEKLETFATKIERHGYVGQRVQPMNYVNSWYSVMNGDIEKLSVPKDINDVKYYWYQEANGTGITLCRESTQKPDPEKELENKKREWLIRQQNKAEQVQSVLRDARYEWLHNGNGLKYDAAAILRAYIRVEAKGCTGVSWDEYSKAKFYELTKVPLKDKGYASFPEEGKFNKAISEHCMATAVALIWAKLDKPTSRPWHRVYNNEERLVYEKSEHLEILYELLTSLGYEMSQEEIQYLCGTHEIYKSWEEAGNE